MDWTIRQAKIEDLESIERIEKDIFVQSAWSPQTIQAELSSEHTYYLVAVSSPEGGERICGYAGLFLSQNATEGDIQTVSVTEGFRKQGIGRALLVSLMDYAKWKGARTLFLEVRADNEYAQRLYKHMGFEAIGVRERYYQPDDMDAIVMKRDLVQSDHVA